MFIIIIILFLYWFLSPPVIGELLRLHNNFRVIYQKKPEIPASEWTRGNLDSTKYITLSLATSGSLLGHLSDSHSQSIEAIRSGMFPISYEDAFSEELEQFDCKILISGRPGSGKTVLLNKLCRDWSFGKCFQNMPVVILVSLRELCSTPVAIELSTIFKLYPDIIFNVDRISKFIEECKGEGFCFALDGLDEYPHFNKHDDFITELIRGSYLPKAAVVVASRLTHSHLVKHLVQMNIEIKGFLPPQIEEYIKENCNSKNVKRLTKYLQSHPNIMDMCKLPLNLAFVTLLHKYPSSESSPFSAIETESGIYWLFLKHLVIRHAKRECTVEDFSVESLADFEEFLSDLSELQSAFFKICEIALISKLKFKLIFSSQEIVKEFKLNRRFINEVRKRGFGILSSYKKVTLESETTIFSFQHQTIQEFLAAYHLQCLSQKERLEQIANSGKESIKNRRNMREVWKFFFGLMMMKNPAEHLECFLELVRCSSKDRDETLFLMKCAFESQSKSNKLYQELMTSLAGMVDVSNIPLGTYDCLAIGHVIARSYEGLRELVMNYCHVGPEGVQALEQQVRNVMHFEALKKMQ